MSPRRNRRIDRHTAEQLLRGEPVRGSEALRRLLTSAATATPPKGELPGEHAAMAAFRAAHLAPDPRRRRLPVLKSALAALLTAKILIPTAAAAVGGIAVAAATGTLPSPGNAPAEQPMISQTHRSSPPPDPTSAAPDTKAATPAPSLAGLCRGYAAEAGSEHGKALDSPAFTDLVTTAGGKDKVSDYCATLLGDKPGNPTPGTPPAGQRDTHPTGAPNPPHPTGRPANPPNPRPTNAPPANGAPATLPPPH
jgi:hypothetical protein